MITREEATDIALKQIEANLGKREYAGIKQLVATFKDETRGVTMGFGRGNFDQWCIYVMGAHPYQKFPTDDWSLNLLKSWTQHRPPEDIYEDFVTIYDLVTPEATYAYTKPVITLIEEISFKYPDYIDACVLWTYFYMGMIAEENKDGAILKKRIKRLGVYQVLIEGVSPKIAADYSRGMSADYLDKVCFYRDF